MKRNGLLFALLAITCAGCAFLGITSAVQTDYLHSPPFTNIVVFVQTFDIQRQDEIERGFQYALNTRGIRCTPYLSLFPPTRDYTDSTKLAMLRKNKYDAALMFYSDRYFSGDSSMIPRGALQQDLSKPHFAGLPIPGNWAMNDALLVDLSSGNIAWRESSTIGMMIPAESFSYYGYETASRLLSDHLAVIDASVHAPVVHKVGQ